MAEREMHEEFFYVPLVLVQGVLIVLPEVRVFKVYILYSCLCRVLIPQSTVSVGPA
jgi:hypothetical protein